MRVFATLMTFLSGVAFLGGCNAAISPEARGYLRAADTSFRRGDDRAAIEAGSRVIRMHPQAEETSEAYYIRGLARCRIGLAKRRKELVRAGKNDLLTALKLARRKDLIARVHCRLGDLDYQSGDLDASGGHYRAVLRHTPAGAKPADEAMYRLGCILQRQGRWGDADLMFNKVAHLFDDTPLAARAEERVYAVRWSIQAGAMSNVAVAKKLRQRLRSAGLDARIDLELRNKRTVRLVRVGSWRTYGQAQANLGKVKRIVSDAFITPAR